MTRNDYKSLLDTADNCGMKILSDEWCCKLLAYVYAYGGGNEAVVMNVKLSEDILNAQKRFNIYGGETPHYEKFEMLGTYLQEAERILKTNDKEFPSWYGEVVKRYNLFDKRK